MAKAKPKTAAGKPDGPTITFRKTDGDEHGFDGVLDTLAGILIDNAERNANSPAKKRRPANAAG